MERSTPLVSIGMSVRNNEKTLAPAVRSIINQTYSNWELLLIDDGSADLTLKVAQSFNDPRIRVTSGGRSMGLPARLNQAIEMSRGELFARMDGDDVSYPQRLERQIDYLLQHPEIDLVGSSMIVYGPGGLVIGKRQLPERHEDICAMPTSGFALAHPTFLGHTSFFRKYMYRKGAVRCEDQDLLLRAYTECRYANVPAILYGFFEQLSLKKMLTGRRTFANSLFTEFRRKGKPAQAIKGIAGQGGRAVLEIVALSSGLDHRLLRHRARPATLQELREWARVWNSVTNYGPIFPEPHGELDMQQA